MKVLIVVLLVVVSNYCMAIEEARGGLGTALDDDLTVILEIDENNQKTDIEEIAADKNHRESEHLPRVEKSLLGTYPGFDRQHFEQNAQQQVYHGEYDGHQNTPQDGFHNHQEAHHTEQGGYIQNEKQATDTQIQIQRFKDVGIIPLEKATLSELEVLEVGEDGRKCVDKMMLREETEYDEILTCDHSYDKRCHTSYVTRYQPHQEEECEEKFRKVCTIDYEQKANQEVVEVCTSSFIPDCDTKGEEVCRTVWASECSTVQVVHEVEDDVANCETVEEERCEDVVEGFRTKQKCDTWPREKCTLDKQKVKKYTPQTSCKKVPRKACSPPGCGVKEGPVNCQDKVKTIISNNPVEECDMEPLRTCKHVTKLVPKLEAVQDCVDVPKEICARSKVNPRRVKKPSIQKWCFTPQYA